jgi:diguanylate cyclase (GGDEF)-like protein
MGTVEIADNLLGALKEEAKTRFVTDDPSNLLGGIVRQHLLDVCAPGFERDPMTGVGTRQALRVRIERAMFGLSWADRSVYQEKFLCIDVFKFKEYVAAVGNVEADVVLRELAAALGRHFGDQDTYRFGGDEFVVVLGSREAWLPEAPQRVVVAHAVVEVAIHRNQHRSGHVSRWIQTHLEGGILASSPEGTHLTCLDPIWLAQTYGRL